MWPSIFTGLPPSGHGRFCGSQLRPGTYDVHGFIDSTMGGEPFWAALGRQGRRVAVIDAPHTDPTPDLNGWQVSGWGSHEGPRFARTAPVPMAADLVERFGRHPADTGCDGYARRGELPRLRRDLLAGISRKGDLAEFFLDREAWDLFFVVFGESHCAGHNFWHLHDRDHPRHDRALADDVGDPLVDVYQALDAEFGRLLEGVAADTMVLLVLSHGMGPNYQANFVLPTILARLERALGGAPPFIGAREYLGHAQRAVARRTRKRLGLASDTPLDVLSRSRRFSRLPNNDSCGAIRFNVVGRDPAGRVRPGQEYDELCGALERELRALVNLETGQPLVREVLRTSDCYDELDPSRWPDLFVEWNRDAPVRAIGSPTIGRIDCEFPGIQTGDHRPAGLVVAAGPSIAPGRLDDPIEGARIAPTICSLLDCELPYSDQAPLGIFVRVRTPE